MAEVAMSSTLRVKGAARVKGELSVPGDKSISHRAAMIASIARGPSSIRNFSTSADCRSTLDCLSNLGVPIDVNADRLVIHGRGLKNLNPEGGAARLDAGNSGSTIRMISGLAAAQSFITLIDGDESLRRRPMRRIIEPLTLMGARIESSGAGFPPLRIQGDDLKPISYNSPVASAQVKTCVLLAGLHAEGATVFTEPARSRNHTELMLKEFGARIEVDESTNRVSVEGGRELNPVDYRVAGDLSSAAFFIAAAALLPGSELLLCNVSLNPSRTAFIEVLEEMGARIERSNVSVQNGEVAGDLRVATSALKTAPGGLRLSGDIIPNLIDEAPILAVVSTQTAGRIELRDAMELRVKESDRIRTIVDGLRGLGADVEEFEDGFGVAGPQRLRPGRVEAAGDHRIAMAFSIAALLADGTTEIVDADSAAVSFPEFHSTLAAVTDRPIYE
jgi:3-phosphoshikimate 1-carboxyvinyltransferase